MNFNSIDRAIKACKLHLDTTGTRNTEIEAYLVGYLLVFISAEFELRVGALVESRAARGGDGHIRSFVKHAARKIVRGPNIDQITGMLGCFDSSCKTAFHQTASQQAQAAYDSIINNRHALVHKATVNATISDVERFFNDSQGVFAGIISGLGLSAAEIAHLT